MPFLSWFLALAGRSQVPAHKRRIFKVYLDLLWFWWKMISSLQSYSDFFLFTCDSGYIDMIYHNRLLKPTDDWNRDDSKSMILIVKVLHQRLRSSFDLLCSNYGISLKNLRKVFPANCFFSMGFCRIYPATLDSISVWVGISEPKCIKMSCHPGGFFQNKPPVWRWGM